MQQKLAYNPTRACSDDGVFWMAFEDFVLNYRNLYVCRIFNVVSSGGTWHKYQAKGSWSRAEHTAGGCPNEDTCDENPHFFVETTTRTTVFVSLSQREEQGVGRDGIVPIGFKLLDKRGRRVKNVYQGEQVMGGSYAHSREVTAEAVLDPKLYTLFVSTFRRGAETDFSVTVYADAPLRNTDGSTLRLIPASVPAD